MENISTGEQMHQWAKDLFPINRSLTGKGVKETLSYLLKLLPGLEIKSVPSGTEAYDWTVPDEWQINDAYLSDEAGNRIIDFCANNLHVIGYSEPVDKWMDLEELQPFLHSLPTIPDAVPYITSYYKRRWGFCISENQRKELKPGKYHAVIDSRLFAGELNYGELVIPGASEKEVLLSTYVCHPSMANNELSGPVVATALALWLRGLPQRKYTYRVIFIPETIGAIVYISKNIEALKRNTIAAFQLTCIGDERCYSFLPSRDGDTLADKVALHVLKHYAPDYIAYSFLNRGSDERQFCAPGVDLPMASIMRSKYGEYAEYHTSLDNLEFVTPAGLAGGFTALQKSIEAIENHSRPKVTVLCEPQLGKRGLYPTLSTKYSTADASLRTMINLIAYADGTRTLLEIAETIGVAVWELYTIFNTLKMHGVLKDLEEENK